MAVSKRSDTATGDLIFYTEAWKQSGDFECLDEIPGVSVHLAYATAANFTGQVLYSEMSRAFLHREAASKFKQAVQILAKEQPGLQFLVLDALRPNSVQKKLFAYVQGSDKEMYVAHPDRGSVHNFGFALDITLKDVGGDPLDLGTPFDDFSDKAQPRLEQKFIDAGEVTPVQMKWRLILRSVMERAGFTQLPFEWWHFDACSLVELRSHYRAVK